MKLQELISQNDLELSLAHIRAFFLGVLSAEKPLPFNKAVEEMLSETPELIGPLEEELKRFWDALGANIPYELQNFFPDVKDLNEFLNIAKEQLDFFLTALTLSGTHAENCENEDIADLIDELEDTVMDLDEYLSESNPKLEEGKELKELVLETWQDYVSTSMRCN